MVSNLLFDGAHVVLKGAASRSDYRLCQYAGANRYMISGFLYCRDGTSLQDNAPLIDFIQMPENATVAGISGRLCIYGPRGAQFGDADYFPYRARA